jgi:hypothetical protein
LIQGISLLKLREIVYTLKYSLLSYKVKERLYDRARVDKNSKKATGDYSP